MAKKPLDPNEPVESGIVTRAYNTALGGLSAVGNILDLPGSVVRDALMLRNPLDQFLSPMSPDNRTTGQDILSSMGLAGKHSSLGKTLAGMAVEIGLDPTTYATLGISAGLTQAGKATKAIGLMDRVSDVATAKSLLKTPVQKVTSLGGPTFPGSDVLSSIARQVTPNTPDAATLSQKLAEGKKLTFAEESFRKGIKPSAPPTKRVGKRQGAMETTLNDMVNFEPRNVDDKGKILPIPNFQRETVLKNLDDYATRNMNMSGSEFLAKYGDQQLSKGASFGLPLTEGVPFDIPYAKNLAIGLDTAEQYLRWGFPGRAAAMMFSSAAGGQFNKTGQEIMTARHQILPQKMSEAAGKMLRSKERMQSFIDDFNDVFNGSEFLDMAGSGLDQAGKPIRSVSFNIDGMKNSLTAMDRMMRYATEISGKHLSTNAPFTGPIKEAADALIRPIGGKPASQMLDEAGLSESMGRFIANAKVDIETLYRDYTMAGGKVNHIGGIDQLITYFPRSWDIEDGDIMRSFREFTVGNEHTKKRATQTALMPAEVVRSLATSPMYRKMDPESLAVLLRKHPDVEPYLVRDPSYSPFDNPPIKTVSENVEVQKDIAALELAKWVQSLPKKLTTSKKDIVYGASPIEDMSNYMEGMTRSITTQRAIYQTLVDSIDDMPGPDALPLADVLKAAGYNAEAAKSFIAEQVGGVKREMLNKLDNAMIPRQVADAVVGITRKSNDPMHMRAIGLWWDKMTSVFKEHLTLPFPSFSIRNLTSGQLMNVMSNHLVKASDYGEYLDDLKLSREVLKNPAKYKDIVDELHIHDVSKYGYSPADVEHASAINMNVIPPRAFVSPGEVQGMVKGAYQDMVNKVAETPTDFPGLWADETLKKAKIDTGGFFTGAKGKIDKAVDKARAIHQTGLEIGRRASAEAEWYNRVPMFLYLRRKGYSAAEAASEVRKIHVDYSDLAPIEKEGMRRVFLFYTFTRKQMEQTAKYLMEKQGGLPGTSVAGTIKAIERLRNPGELVPDYVAETSAIPLGGDSEGNRHYLTGLGMAFEDPISFMGKGLRGAGMETLSRMHPVIKAPLEYSTGELFFQAGPGGGRDLLDADPLIGRLAANITGRKDAYRLPELVEVAAANSPISRFLTTARQVTDTRRGAIMKGTNLLSGLRVSTVSPGASDAILRENVHNMMRGMGGQEFVRSYIPDSLKAEMSPEELKQATRLNDTLNTLARRAKARKEMQEPKPK